MANGCWSPAQSATAVSFRCSVFCHSKNHLPESGTFGLAKRIRKDGFSETVSDRAIDQLIADGHVFAQNGISPTAMGNGLREFGWSLTARDTNDQLRRRKYCSGGPASGSRNLKQFNQFSLQVFAGCIGHTSGFALPSRGM